MRISSGSLIQSQGQFYPEDAVRLSQLAQVSWSSKKTLVYHEKFFGIFSLQSYNKKWLAKKVRRTSATALSMKTSAKSNRDQQRVARWTNATQHRLLSVGLYLYPFPKSHVLSSIYSNKISRAPFPDCLLKDTCLFSAKHPPHICFNKNILS